jgi:ATP-dependent DNA ligase
VPESECYRHVRFLSPHQSRQSTDWIHEIKDDGYRMMVIREQDHVRLISRGGHDWARHFPLIVTAALKLRQKQFVLDGEVVVLNKDGVSDFDALASRKHDRRALFYAFDMLAGDGEDFRPQALVMRKASLARLLSRPVDGIFIAEYERLRFRCRPETCWALEAAQLFVKLGARRPRFHSDCDPALYRDFRIKEHNR